MDEQNLKDSWNKTKACFAGAGMPTDVNLNRATTLDRLAQRYKQFYSLAAASTFAAPLLLFLFFTPLICILWCSYFAIAFGMDFYLYRRIRSINVQRMTVREVIRIVLSCRKFHIICIFILMPLAITLLSLTAYNNFDNKYFMVGMACGFIGGLAVGVIKLCQFLDDYRDLTKDE